MSHPKTALSLAACGLLITGVVLHAAGPLTPPPGPVTSNFKTLTEVQPRTTVDATNTQGNATSVFRITAHGSYYLTGNVPGAAGKNGIQIESDGVTLDLMGFELRGGINTLDGVNMLNSRINVVICNGSIKDWGGDGIDARISNGRIERISASDNGEWGILNSGFSSSTCILSCEAYGNGSGVVAGGISTGSGAVIQDCTAGLNTGIGIGTFSDCTVSGCTARGNSGVGIDVASDCRVVDNTCDSDGLAAADGAGIHVTGSDNRIDSNNVTDNDRGIDVDSTGNLIMRNSASGNTTSYSIATGNSNAQVVSPAANFVSTDPWANFAF